MVAWSTKVRVGRPRKDGSEEAGLQSWEVKKDVFRVNGTNAQQDSQCGKAYVTESFQLSL